ncbi:hypothetical protein G3N57_22460 [Paraburkholderia sp. Se-20369]|nr:hypothetical protein [Paraburkholderia sp. Se-20369]
MLDFLSHGLLRFSWWQIVLFALASQTVETGGTVRMRACMPGTLSMPFAIASARSRVAPWRL